MKQTIEDKLVSKVSKGKLNTIHVSREEMADLVDQHFIQNAETEEEQDFFSMLSDFILQRKQKQVIAQKRSTNRSGKS